MKFGYSVITFWNIVFYFTTYFSLRLGNNFIYWLDVFLILILSIMEVNFFRKCSSRQKRIRISVYIVFNICYLAYLLIEPLKLFSYS